MFTSYAAAQACDHFSYRNHRCQTLIWTCLYSALQLSLCCTCIYCTYNIPSLPLWPIQSHTLDTYHISYSLYHFFYSPHLWQVIVKALSSASHSSSSRRFRFLPLKICTSLFSSTLTYRLIDRSHTRLKRAIPLSVSLHHLFYLSLLRQVIVTTLSRGVRSLPISADFACLGSFGIVLNRLQCMHTWWSRYKKYSDVLDENASLHTHNSFVSTYFFRMNTW